MVENSKHRYNKMYYIVSVGDDDNPSFEVADYVNEELGMGDGFCKQVFVNNLNGWNETIYGILSKSTPCSIPILFVECHGDDKGNLVIGGRDSKDRVKMNSFLGKIKALEKKCKQRILLILAVCNGLCFFRKKGRLRKTTPCSCIIGTYTIQTSFDIEGRIKLFLKNFLGSTRRPKNVKSAFYSMNKAYRGDVRKQEMHKNKRYVLLTRKKEYYLKKIAVGV